MKLLKSLFPAFLVLFLIMQIWHPHPYNTEQVCFDKVGNVIFYSSGYKPSNAPMVYITGDVYKNTDTGDMIKAECRARWGVNPPKGVDYWKPGV
ncbi:MAG: hypothetical protein GY941_12815 [Planctomycetes bacterium]|nr:hypothetical protein [Planctomycetota bacterium]